MKKLTEKELYDLSQEKSQESIDAYIEWLTATFGFSHDKFHWDDGSACAFRAGIRYGYRLADKKILEEDMIDDVLNDLERLAKSASPQTILALTAALREAIRGLEDYANPIKELPGLENIDPTNSIPPFLRKYGGIARITLSNITEILGKINV